MPEADGAGRREVAEARLEAVMPHHRDAWRVERIAWTIMALFLLATLLGAFGGGPLSHARTGSRDAAELEYERLLRAAAPTEYRLRVQPSLAADGVLAVRVDQPLVDMMQLDSVVPEPASVSAGDGYTEFRFRVATGTRGAAHVAFRFQPATFGRFRGAVTVSGAPPLRVSHFIYP